MSLKKALEGPGGEDVFIVSDNKVGQVRVPLGIL